MALAARMRLDEKAVRRILSGDHVSFDRILQALRAVDIRLGLAV